ncbi:YitT family protein [Alteromonas aestuariivivens]|uniref:YitT family protein n=1 Tax=Alteromonas aestuariivivens TaxID=1938339 RepID=A0A3D8M9H7_9ALTE|nr:YitT family protein [Alteromonas aestuariivivens]RDV26626.1 YitT family protein [Alteromonas aestuariivivens]
MQKRCHSIVEDIFALICAGLFVAFGVYLFQSQNLMVGGVAGLALLGTHWLSLDFSVLFFIINLPFYLLAWRYISKRFTLNTFTTVATVSLMSEYLPQFVNISQVHPIFAAIFGGILIGVGMLMMFRHTSSMGGLGILAFFLQSRFGVRAGSFQLAVDSAILLSALTVIDVSLVMISVLAALCLNMVISLNHRPERYSLPMRQANASEELVDSELQTQTS